MKRVQATLIMVASSAVTVVALLPLSRTVSKISPDILRILSGVFWRQSVSCLVVGACAILLGIEMQQKSPVIGWAIVLLSPLLVLIANFLLLLVVLPQG